MTTGLVSRITDTRIAECSGFAASASDADLLWVTIDESSNPQVFGIEISTGKTVATFSLKGAGTFKDSEALCVDPWLGTFYLGDLGDNDLNRTDIGIGVLKEPGRGNHGPLTAKRVPVVYSDKKKRDAEALFIHPESGQLFIISKEATHSKLFSLPNPLPIDGRIATATLVTSVKTLPAWVTDATFNFDGSALCVRVKKTNKLYTYRTSDWKLIDTITTASMEQPESITLEHSGKSVLLGSEGKNSPIYRVDLPAWATPKGAEVDYMDPANYGDGKKGPQITWLGQRLVVHGFSSHYQVGPGPSWGESDKLNVQDFQRAQGWTGSAADGYPGKETLKRLAADPLVSDYLDPSLYGPGKVGPQITWLGERLVAHDFDDFYTTGPGPVWGEADRLNVQAFQLSQGWKGEDADGYPGKETLKRLAADPVIVIPPPTNPGTAKLPSDILNLTNWKITLPDASEVKQPDLKTFKSPFFFVDGTGVAFRAPVDGPGTTPNSSYPRSELREMTDNGKTLAKWDSAVGTHRMTIRQAIVQIPVKKPHVVAGQIHGADDDVVMIRLEGKHLFVESRGTDVGTLDSNYTLGAVFTVEVDANKNGISVRYYKNGSASPNAIVSINHLTAKGCYFKAGCYTQSNLEKGDKAPAAGEVVIYDLKVEHA